MLSFLSAALSVSISHQLDTITTLEGLFAYTRLLWCIVRTRDLALQRAIKQIVQWLQSTSATCHLVTAMERLQTAGPRPRLEKSTCHRLDAEGIHPTTEKLGIAANSSSNMIVSPNYGDGLVNYYHKFLKDVSTGSTMGFDIVEVSVSPTI